MSKTCFIVTAIGSPGSPENEHANKVLTYLIKPVCEELGYQAVRVDTETVNGNINDRIINHLKNDELVIADMTSHNPNAFFELGYRQALGLPLVPIIVDSEPLPFDVAAENTVFYNTDVSKIEDSKQRLKAMMSNFDDFIMPKDRAKTKTEFDVINEKLDKLIQQTKPSSFSTKNLNLTSSDFNSHLTPKLSETLSQQHILEDRK